MSKPRLALAVGALCLAALAVYYLALRQHVLHLTDTRGEVYVALGLLIAVLLGLLVAGVAAVVAALRHRRARVARGALVVSGGAAVLLVAMVGLSQATAYTPTVEGVRPISELRPIQVNGRTEWLTIRGQDRTKPVLLFLSGGPGGSQLATARYYFAPLENDYVVVTWEQPGAAKSFGAIAPENITLDTYLDDGAAVVQALRTEFGHDKVFLMGESWGSALGLMMIEQHPEYYAAFLGTGQMVAFLETEKIDYAMALQDAQARGDQALVARLTAQGPPPYDTDVAWKTNAYLSPLYGVTARTGQIGSAPFSTMDGPLGVEYGLWDKVMFFWGLLRTFDTFYPSLYPIDLRTSAATQQVPVFIFHGRYDYNAPLSLVEDYYATLSAPAKQLTIFEHSGHNPWQTENALFVQKAREAFAQASGR